MGGKIPLDSLVDSLLQEASQNFHETPGLKWEWDHYCRLHDLITKIEEKELNRNSSFPDDSNLISPAGSDDERRLSNFSAFKSWLTENGVNFEKVDIIRTGRTGFGLQTKVPLQTGDLVFTVPKSIILTSDKARASKIKLLVEKDPLLTTMENVLLAIFLVHEKFVNQQSFWAPYIDVLPTKFDTVLYFTKNEMTLMKQSQNCFREALRMYRNVTRQYAYFHIKFKKATDSASRNLKSCFTFSRYIWAVSAVTTRINHIPCSGNIEETLSLIPLWDMCNHAETEVLSTDYSDEENKLICYASQDYEADSEFKIYYGRRSSVEFVVHNGFVPRSHRDDSYSLELGISINDPLHTRKKAILGHLGLQCQMTFNVKPERLSSSSYKNLTAFLRVFLADKELLEKIEANLEDLEFLKETTVQCWKFLATRFELLLSSAEKSMITTVKNIFGHVDNSEEELSNASQMLLQLFKNEHKILEMLVHCSKDHVKHMEMSNGHK